MITSPHNLKIQLIRALLAKKATRHETTSFVVEGVRLAEEVLANGFLPEYALFTDQLSERGQSAISGFRAMGVQIDEVSVSVMNAIAGTESPQGLILVLKFPAIPISPFTNFALILDNLRDPGNLGTILRSASAAGVQIVFLTPGSVDPYSPKVVRSAMGAHFRLPIIETNWNDIIRHCQDIFNPPLNIYFAEGKQGIPYCQIDLRQPIALIIGNEAEGVNSEARSNAQGSITISMTDNVESLNAAIAGSILLFEVVRQRKS
jgi:TrmH family RNA methyltransferase